MLAFGMLLMDSDKFEILSTKNETNYNDRKPKF